MAAARDRLRRSSGCWRRGGSTCAAERLLFALVANRALEPFSKLACCEWLAGDVAIPGLAADAVGEDPQPLYRAMDWLLEVEAELAEQVYWAVADLLEPRGRPAVLRHHLDVLRDRRARPRPSTRTAWRGRRSGTFGHSKDHRADLPQVRDRHGGDPDRDPDPRVVLAGQPGRSAAHPPGQGRPARLEAARGWCGSPTAASTRPRTAATCSAPAGTTSSARSCAATPSEAQAALARQGRYRTVAGNLEVKEVRIDDGTMRDRFVICRNPDQAERDQAVRDQLLAQLEDAIAGSDAAAARPSAPSSPPACRPSPGSSGSCARPRAGCCASTAPPCAPRRISTASSCCAARDPTLSAEDIALGYKQLLEVERGWRDMKTTLDLRPVHHRKEDRIRAHVLLCWLALLLIRLAENQTADTWRNLRRELERMHQGTFRGNAGLVHKTSEPTAAQLRILRALGLEPPPTFPALSSPRSPARPPGVAQTPILGTRRTPSSRMNCLQRPITVWLVKPRTVEPGTRGNHQTRSPRNPARLSSAAGESA